MFERCENCTGALRASCDTRNTLVAELFSNCTEALVIAHQNNDLVTVSKVEDLLMESCETFDSAMERDGCTIDELAQIERLGVEITLRTWEQTDTEG